MHSLCSLSIHSARVNNYSSDVFLYRLACGPDLVFVLEERPS